MLSNLILKSAVPESYDPIALVPSPLIKSILREASKSPSEVLSTLTSGDPRVASDRIREPSASHRSVPKLYTSEWEPVTFDAAFEWVPPLNCLVSNPNPPVVGSELKLLPTKTKVFSTSKVAVLM